MKLRRLLSSELMAFNSCDVRAPSIPLFQLLNLYIPPLRKFLALSCVSFFLFSIEFVALFLIFFSIFLPLLGVVSVGGSIRLRKTKVGKQFPEVAESASKYMDEAEAYLKQQGSLEGYPRFTDPTGEKYLVRQRGGGRLAMSPMSVKQAYTKTRKGRDVTSDSFEKFQRKQFDQMVKENKTDLMVQFAEMPSYVEHNRRLSSPYWKTARAKGQKAGDVDNLTQLFDLDFKNFKDNVDKTLDRITNSPVDAFYDPMVDSIVVENIKTGKRLGYLDQGLDIQEQLSRFIDRAL